MDKNCSANCKINAMFQAVGKIAHTQRQAIASKESLLEVPILKGCFSTLYYIVSVTDKFMYMQIKFTSFLRLNPARGI